MRESCKTCRFYHQTMIWYDREDIEYGLCRRYPKPRGVYPNGDPRDLTYKEPYWCGEYQEASNDLP